MISQRFAKSKKNSSTNKCKIYKKYNLEPIDAIAKTMVRVRGSYALELMFRDYPGEAHFYNLDGEEIEKQTTEIKWDAEAAEKAGFEHFMMKEIHEQPKAVQDTLNSVTDDQSTGFLNTWNESQI